MKLPKAYAIAVPKKAIDMTLSVNPLGCSPRALKALRSMSMKSIRTYPNQTPLVKLIAASFTTDTDNVLLGVGSEQLIKLVCTAFLTRGSIAAIESGSFFLFSREPLLVGAKTVFFDFATPTRFRRRPDVLFIANPTTPGGLDRSNRDILRVMDSINPKIAVIDEANGEFRDDSLISEIPARPNLIVLRTFSKALGLAGLRIGVALGSAKNIGVMSEFQQPFPVSSVALIAAEASLGDTAFLRTTKQFIAKEREFLTDALIKRGFGVSPSVTNNLFVTRTDSKKIVRALAAKEVSVIDGSFFPNNNQRGFRISLRDKRTNRKFLARLDEVLACLTPNKLLGSEEAI